MSRKRKSEGLWVDVPLHADVVSPTVFSIQFTEAEIRALASGYLPQPIQDTCIGLLEWLKDEPGLDVQKIRPGSAMKPCAERASPGDPAAAERANS